MGTLGTWATRPLCAHCAFHAGPGLHRPGSSHSLWAWRPQNPGHLCHVGPHSHKA